MPTIWKRRDPKNAADIQAKAQKRWDAMKEAGDTRSPKVKKQEQEIDQVFEVEQVNEPDDGGSNFLRDFWDSLTK